ncbi:PTS system glucose-specific transporter subunit IIB [Mycoplasmopsis pulmonis]|nr:PTS system glucose-specific transporter subunit IIB [Mycoplasmopsis pulmonis]
MLFLKIITFGLIKLHWKKQAKKLLINNSQNIKFSFNIDDLITNLGGLDNILNCSSTISKLKIDFVEKDKINLEKLNKIKEISGVFFSPKSISLIVGNGAKNIEKYIQDSKGK